MICNPTREYDNAHWTYTLSESSGERESSERIGSSSKIRRLGNLTCGDLKDRYVPVFYIYRGTGEV